MASLRTSLNQGQTNFQHTFAARVYFYDEIHGNVWSTVTFKKL